MSPGRLKCVSMFSADHVTWQVETRLVPLQILSSDRLCVATAYVSVIFQYICQSNVEKFLSVACLSLKESNRRDYFFAIVGCSVMVKALCYKPESRGFGTR
jgi:hypothetical protein